MSSFRKRQVQKPIPGTLTSPQTGQIITSSGNPSLDALLGGGLPIGSICLIEEDKYVTYSRVLAKYFLAEGISSEQCCFLGSLDDQPNEILEKLPKPLTDQEAETEKSAENNNDGSGLRIAWRYHGLPMVNSEQKNLKIGHHFNLMEYMDTSRLCHVTDIWNDTEEEDLNVTDDGDKVHDLLEVSYYGTEDNDNKSIENDVKVTETKESPPHSQDEKIFYNQKYLRILKRIQKQLSSNLFREGERGGKFICRICITSLGSPLWYDEHFAKDILKFFTILRSMVRNTTSVCLITMPFHVIKNIDSTLVQKIRNLVDYAIELESFAGSEKETNHAYKEYNGFLQLRKMTAINSLSVYQPETTDLAFKLRRKSFVIEKLHLPPELQESSEAGKKSAEILSSPSCSFQSLPSKKIDLEF